MYIQPRIITDGSRWRALGADAGAGTDAEMLPCRKRGLGTDSVAQKTISEAEIDRWRCERLSMTPVDPQINVFWFNGFLACTPVCALWGKVLMVALRDDGWSNMILVITHAQEVDFPFP